MYIKPNVDNDPAASAHVDDRDGIRRAAFQADAQYAAIVKKHGKAGEDLLMKYFDKADTFSMVKIPGWRYKIGDARFNRDGMM